MSNDPTWVPEPMLFYADDGDSLIVSHQPDCGAVIDAALALDSSDVLFVFANDTPARLVCLVAQGRVWRDNKVEAAAAANAVRALLEVLP